MAKVQNTEKKRRRNRDATQRELLEAAIRVFAAEGYDSATTRAIAQEAGVAEGLIQRYFEGKQGLLIAFMRQFALDEKQSCTNLPPKADSFRDELKSLTADAIERAKKDKEKMKVAIPRAIIDRNVGKELARFVKSVHAPAIRTRLKQHQDGGTLLESADLEALSYGLVLLMFGVAFFGQVVIKFNPEMLSRIVDSLANSISGGSSAE
jgi:AcrR family transcriptional regulator